MEKVISVKPTLPGFTRRQKTALKKPPDQKFIQTRIESGKELSYLEGWYVIAEANRIFGPENWDRVTLATQCVWQGKSENSATSTYTARVRICVRVGAYTLVREGSGFGQGRGRDPGEAQGWALKAAETDATKRALATMGAPFGLTLYAQENLTKNSSDSQHDNNPDPNAIRKTDQFCHTEKPGSPSRVTSTSKKSDTLVKNIHSDNPYLLCDATGQTLAAYHDPVQFCSALRRSIENASEKKLLEAVFKANRRGLARLVVERPELRSEGDQHYSTILAALHQVRLKRLSEEEANTEYPEEKFQVERQAV